MKLKTKITCGLILFSVVLLTQSCSSNPKSLLGNHIGPKLTPKEELLVDRWGKDNITECGFLYSDKATPTFVKSTDIMKCIDSFEVLPASKITPYNFPETLSRKLTERELDYGIGKKLTQYVGSLSKDELASVLNFLVHMKKGENHYLVKLLIDHGAEADGILLRDIHTATSNPNTCMSALLILESNKYLYKTDESLNKLVKYKLRPKNFLYKGGSASGSHASPPGYRKDALYFAISDPAYLKCSETTVAEALININPELRDVKHQRDGNTALHNYARYFSHFYLPELRDSGSRRIAFGKKLVTSKNVNIQNSEGKTPLHRLLYTLPPIQKDRLAFVNILIDRGANLDLKDNKGVSIREMMSKFPELSSSR